MKFYKTIINNGEVRFEFIEKAYLTAANGFSAIIFKEGKTWNATEIISGAVLFTGETKKAVMERIDWLIKTKTPAEIKAAIESRIAVVESLGAVLPNIAERNA